MKKHFRILLLSLILTMVLPAASLPVFAEPVIKPVTESKEVEIETDSEEIPLEYPPDDALFADDAYAEDAFSENTFKTEETLTETGLSNDEEMVNLSEIPQTPALKSAKSTENGAKFSWKAVSGASHYQTYRWNGAKQLWIKLGTTTSTSYTDTTVASGSKRFYTVSAVSGGQEGNYDYNGIVSAYLTAVKPDLFVIRGKVKLKWKTVEGAEGYKIYRRPKGETSWTKIADTNELVYVDSTLEGGSAFDYCVRAYLVYRDVTYLSYLSKNQCVSVAIPKTPVIRNIASKVNGIKFNWNAEESAVKYVIYRKEEGESSFKKYDETSVCSYRDDNAQQGKVYCYTVAAVNAQDSEGFHHSDGKKGVFFPEVKDVALTNISGVKVTWNEVKGADGYRLYRKTPGEGYKAIADVTDLMYKDLDGSSGKKYAYFVRAYKLIDNKKFFGFYNADNRVLILRLDTPRPKAAAAPDFTVKVTWEAINGASAYEVFRKNPDTGEWIFVKTVFTNEYVKSKVTPGELLTFSVVAKKGEYRSNMRKPGATATYLDFPVMVSASSVYKGITVKWKSVKNATGYRVYRKATGSSWKTIGYTTDLSFTDQDIQAGVKYRYFARAYVSQGDNKYCGICDTSKAIKRYYTHPSITLAKKKAAQFGDDLEDAYEWVVSLEEKEVPDSDDLLDYAYWGLSETAGDSFSRAAAFCMIATEMGYDATLVSGSIQLRSGQSLKHGWALIGYDGFVYVCDPDYECDTGNSGYLINYGQYGTWVYEEDHYVS